MELIPQDSCGRLVVNRVQVLDASYPSVPHMTFEIVGIMRPGEHTGAIEITEVDSSNFGAASFRLNVP